MNHSMYRADYRTHIKVFTIGLLGALLVVAVGTFGHIGPTDLGTEPLVKAASRTVMSGTLGTIR
jgi:hypothetical protein